MRPRVQVKYVTEHMNYLEDKIHVIKPVVEALQAAVDKSKTWLEDKRDNESLTYCDLCQELESATLTLLDVAAHILDENKDIFDVGRSFSSQSTSQTKAEKCGTSQSTDQILNELYKSPEILSRLVQIETTISSLQDANDKSTDDISEIKQWRDNFVTEQSDMGIDNIENTISKCTKEIHLIESRVCNRYACYVTLADHTPVSVGSIISTFKEVREYNGQHFNRTTGTFVSPHDGLYLVCVTLHEWRDNFIEVTVWAGDRCCTGIAVKCAATSAAGSVVVDLKKGQELYFHVSHAYQDAILTSYSSFTIISL
ncbi:uncharacterized protein LOC131947358 isoform X2 [Physella acuta]|uniref:uncharacterized protein LOC131947358 isoform X2 n=1 Tax=Physella acuta TaxID=109671 RepID=UPI0027DDD616|nr:uncharacterized protein LOC131947358 isoform X2 [Physella acuta]